MITWHQQYLDHIFLASVQAATLRLDSVLERSHEENQNWSKSALRSAMYDVKVDLEKATNRRHTDQRELEQLKWKDAKSKVCLLCGLSGCIYDINHNTQDV